MWATSRQRGRCTRPTHRFDLGASIANSVTRCGRWKEDSRTLCIRPYFAPVLATAPLIMRRANTCFLRCELARFPSIYKMLLHKCRPSVRTLCFYYTFASTCSRSVDEIARFNDKSNINFYTYRVLSNKQFNPFAS